MPIGKRPPRARASADRLAIFDLVRLCTLVLIVVLLLGRVFYPTVFNIDGTPVFLIVVVVVALLVLAPSLTSAKLPGGTEFQFRQKIEQKIDAAE